MESRTLAEVWEEYFSLQRQIREKHKEVNTIPVGSDEFIAQLKQLKLLESQLPVVHAKAMQDQIKFYDRDERVDFKPQTTWDALQKASTKWGRVKQVLESKLIVPILNWFVR